MLKRAKSKSSAAWPLAFLLVVLSTRIAAGQQAPTADANAPNNGAANTDATASCPTDGDNDLLNGCCGAEQSLWFQADWMWTIRSQRSFSTANFVDGANPVSFNDMGSFDGSSGVRLQAAALFQGLCWEGVYTDWRGANGYLTRTLPGVAFNGGATWAGEDFINSSTFFAPINAAASLTTPANTLSDQSGLGPNANFPLDSAPKLYAFYHSNFALAEANVKSGDLFWTGWGGGLRWGLGFGHADENEVAQVILSGTFRAVSNLGGATVNLPNSVLTQTPGAGLSLASGSGGGFTDGSNGTNIPSNLAFSHTAYTHNDLNGGQLVVDGTLARFGRISLGGKIQAGVFENRATGDIQESYRETNGGASVYTRELQNTRNSLSFLGGCGANASIDLTDHIAFTAGYDFVYVSGLALGPQQMGGVNGNFYEVQTSGSLFEQAVHAGFTLAY